VRPRRLADQLLPDALYRSHGAYALRDARDTLELVARRYITPYDA